MNPLVSIIVPVYNVESYLEKCLKSIITQTYGNLEILLVDDGSQDQSGLICDNTAKMDHRIRVIHQKNSGVSAARNNGIDNVTGDYLCFIDGDDYVTDSYVKNMLDIMLAYHMDIVTTNQYKIWHDGQIVELFKKNKPYGSISFMSGIDTLAHMLYGKTCYATCCSKLYKRDIFSNIRFPKLSMGEDSYTMYQCFLKAKNVAHLYQPNYYYVQHTASAMHSQNFEKFYDYICLSDNFINTVNREYPELIKPAVNRLIENNFWVYMKMRNDPNHYQMQLSHIVDNIKHYRGIALKDSNVHYRTRAACLLSYGGMHVLDMIYDKINKNNKQI